jgi:pimeloyl-ACP methyl ester carboxylesterase
MARNLRLILVVLFVFCGLYTYPTVVIGSTCVDGVQASGAIYKIWMPDAEDWNGDLVVYAHGYVSPFEPIAIPDEQLFLPDGTSIPGIINSLGFAFATTSYRINGLAVKQGTADLVDLVGIFESEYGEPEFVYLVGASEGGLITTLALEKHSDVFDAGLATCGPIGDFRRHINYLGDFRVVFDYFFPGMIPGSPIQIPRKVRKKWENLYVPRITAAIIARPHAVEQLLRVTGAAIDKNDLTSVVETIIGVLWYNVFATNDSVEKLGGNPFDNTRRIYLGSDHDWWLNHWVQRFAADPAALAEIEANYQTSGQLDSPLITLHNTLDPIVPYWHEQLYRWKTVCAGSWLQHINIPVFRYGHCNFETDEVLTAFVLLVLKTKLGL